MRKHFLTFLLIGLFACKSEEVPTDILSVNKMAVILIDIHLAEGKIKEMRLEKDSANLAYTYYEKEILKKHAVEPDVYEKSFKYHLGNITSMDEIYSIVVDSLNVRRALTKID